MLTLDAPNKVGGGLGKIRVKGGRQNGELARIQGVFLFCQNVRGRMVDPLQKDRVEFGCGRSGVGHHHILGLLFFQAFFCRQRLVLRHEGRLNMDKLLVTHREGLVLDVAAREPILLRMRRRLGEPHKQVGLVRHVLDLPLQNGGPHHGRVPVCDEGALTEGARIGGLGIPLAVHCAFEIVLQDHNVIKEAEILGAKIVVLVEGVGPVPQNGDFGGPPLGAHGDFGTRRPLQRVEVEKEFGIVLFGGIDANHALVLVLLENRRHAVFVGRTDSRIGRDLLLFGQSLLSGGALLLLSVRSEQGIVDFLESVQEPSVGHNHGSGTVLFSCEGLGGCRSRSRCRTCCRSGRWPLILLLFVILQKAGGQARCRRRRSSSRRRSRLLQAPPLQVPSPLCKRQALLRSHKIAVLLHKQQGHQRTDSLERGIRVETAYLNVVKRVLSVNIEVDARVITLHEFILLGHDQGKGSPALIPLPNRLLGIPVRQLKFLLEFDLEHRRVLRPQLQNGLRQERKLVGFGRILADGLVAQGEKGLGVLVGRTLDFLKEGRKEGDATFEPVLAERRSLLVQLDLEPKAEFAQPKILGLLRKSVQHGGQRFAKVDEIRGGVEQFHVLGRLKKKVGGAILQ